MSPLNPKIYNIWQDWVFTCVYVVEGGLVTCWAKPYWKTSQMGQPSALITLTLVKLTFSDSFLSRMTKGNDPPSRVKFCVQASLGSLLQLHFIFHLSPKMKHKRFFLIRSQPTTIVALIYFSVVQWVLHIVVLFVQLSHEVVFFPFSLVCRLGKSTSLN